MVLVNVIFTGLGALSVTMGVLTEQRKSSPFIFVMVTGPSRNRWRASFLPGTNSIGMAVNQTFVLALVDPDPLPGTY